MCRFVRNFFAFVRGWCLMVLCCVFHRKRIRIGKRLRVFNSVSLRFTQKAKLNIGIAARIDAYSLISIVSNGCVILGNNVAIGRNNSIVCHKYIEIGDGTILAPNVMIYDHDHIFTANNGVNQKEYKKSEVVIGKNCWIGANTTILRGTIIGDNCVIGAGSIIKGVYESGSLIIQKRETVCKRIS